MKYKNIKTGAIIDSASIVKGDNWEEVKSVNLQDLTKSELTEALDEKGIEYNTKDTKDELIKLLEE